MSSHGLEESAGRAERLEPSPTPRDAEFLRRFVGSAWELSSGENVRVLVVALPKELDAEYARAVLAPGGLGRFDTDAHHREMVGALLVGAAALARRNLDGDPAPALDCVLQKAKKASIR